MPLWNDPLDELIADLEKAVPATKQEDETSVRVTAADLRDLRVGSDILLYPAGRTPEEIERRLRASPAFRRSMKVFGARKLK